MVTLSLVTWMTVCGLSLVFVGGFVLWVYGSQKINPASDIFAQADGAGRRSNLHLVRWFLLYGATCMFLGIGLLLTATVLVI